MTCIVVIELYALLAHDGLDLLLVKLPAMWKKEQQQKDALRSAPREIIRKRQQERIRVSVVLELEAGR